MIETLLNIVTLGGHGKFTDAQNKYIIIYDEYLSLCESHKNQQEILNNLISNTGIESERTTFLLSKCINIFEYGNIIRYQTKQNLNTRYSNTNTNLINIYQYVQVSSSALSAAKGAGIGYTTAFGAWSLVSLLGTASTGTAIGTLSGAAATNAALAWFGGGSLAVGGAGMAGGTLALGGLFAIPMIAYAAWSTHSKAEQIDTETIKIQSEIPEITNKIEEICRKKALIFTEYEKICDRNLRLANSYSLAKSKIFPLGKITFFCKLVRCFFGFYFYSTQDVKAMWELERSVSYFMSDITVPIGQTKPHAYSNKFMIKLNCARIMLLAATLISIGFYLGTIM